MSSQTRAELEVINARQDAQILRLGNHTDDLNRMLADAQANSKDLELQLAVKQTHLDAANQSYEAARKDRDKAREEMRGAHIARDLTLGEFDELKARLFTAETENHRLQGYIDRVYEDDVAREGFVEAPSSAAAIMQPRRPSAMRSLASVHTENCGGGEARTVSYAAGADHRSPRRHWTSYGSAR